MVEAAGYGLAMEPETGLLRITLSGLWDEETLSRFHQDVRRAVDGTRAARPGQRPALLIDRRAAAVQTQQIMERLREIVAEFERAGVRVAVIAGTMLQKLQAQRVGNLERRVFMNEDEARAWLLRDDAD